MSRLDEYPLSYSTAEMPDCTNLIKNIIN